MAQDLLRRRTIAHLEDWLTACSTVREIEALCDEAGIAHDTNYEANATSVRRSTFRQHVATLDLAIARDVRKLLTVFESVFELIDTRGASSGIEDYCAQQKATMLKALERDGFRYDGSRMVTLAGGPSLQPLKDHAESADATYLARQAQRLEHAVSQDPWLAIGTAKEMVETTCKTILAERNVVIDSSWDLMELVGATRKSLTLTPDDIPNGAKSAKTIKTLLNNLGTIVQGLAELRNTYGTGHGPLGKAKGLRERHARLAAGAATTLATFLLDTHQARD